MYKVASLHKGKIQISSSDPIILSSEGFLDEISKLEVPILLELEDSRGYEYTYVLSFPSMNELNEFMREFSKIAHIKAVLKASLSGRVVLPRWMTQIVAKYEGKARYNIMEKWLAAQNL